MVIGDWWGTGAGAVAGPARRAYAAAGLCHLFLPLGGPGADGGLAAQERGHRLYQPRNSACHGADVPGRPRPARPVGFAALWRSARAAAVADPGF